MWFWESSDHRGVRKTICRGLRSQVIVYFSLASLPCSDWSVSQEEEQDWKKTALWRWGHRDSA